MNKTMASYICKNPDHKPLPERSAGFYFDLPGNEASVDCPRCKDYKYVILLNVMSYQVSGRPKADEVNNG